MMQPRSGPSPIALGLGLIVVGMVAFVAYAVTSKSPPTNGGLKLHIPGVDQVVGAEHPCPDSVYPPGALYRFETCDGTTPVGWRPCSTVTFAVDPTEAPSGYFADVQDVIAQLQTATGLHLVQVASKPNISITWDATLYDPRPGTTGEAGVTTFRSSGGKATSAAIRLSSHLGAGGANQIGEEPVLLHEFGHAVGLGHVDGAEVMDPMDRGLARYQSGDLAGLARLYPRAGCA